MAINLPTVSSSSIIKKKKDRPFKIRNKNFTISQMSESQKEEFYRKREVARHNKNLQESQANSYLMLTSQTSCFFVLVIKVL